MVPLEASLTATFVRDSDARRVGDGSVSESRQFVCGFPATRRFTDSHRPDRPGGPTQFFPSGEARHVHTVLFYVQLDNEVPVLVPVEVLSREPDGHGNLKLAEPLKMKGASSRPCR